MDKIKLTQNTEQMQYFMAAAVNFQYDKGRNSFGLNPKY